MKLTTAVTALALAAGASAQFSVPGLSAGCTRTFAGFVLGDLSSCLQVTALLPVISSGGNSSVVDSLNGYLTAFCSKDTPQCKNDSLTSAATSVRNGCQDELADPASLPNLFLTVLDNYTPVRGAACSKNETNGDFCASDALNTIQNTTGIDVTFNTVTSLLGGDGSVAERLQQALGTGQLCTGCVANIYAAALQVNSTISNSSIGRAVTGQCGANFGANITGVSAPSSNNASASASAAAATPSATGAAGALTFSAGALVAAALAVVAL